MLRPGSFPSSRQLPAAPGPGGHTHDGRTSSPRRGPGAVRPWKKWGPYLSERQWGTVREDYSEGGDAWDYFTHDQARSRAYRWGEDGLAGISDDQQRLCFALALWNGKDPILKERLFGLTNSESNHGEDVKEYYFYLDSTPTHSYMKYLYKYPQAAFPYADLVETSRGRGRNEFEYELLDTGVFDEDRYFDVFVEYAKASPEDILIQITVHNRGPEAAELHVLPTLWFRNQWSWHGDRRPADARSRSPATGTGASSRPIDAELGERYLYCEGDAPLLFTENETNTQRIFGVAEPHARTSRTASTTTSSTARQDAVNPEQDGDEGRGPLPPDGRRRASARSIRLRLCDVAPAGFAQANGDGDGPFGGHFDEVLRARRQGGRRVLRRRHPAVARRRRRPTSCGRPWRACSGASSSTTTTSTSGSRSAAPTRSRPTRKAAPRNDHWHHMYNGDVISMPDKWEYPWYAAWDLAFHVLALTLVDPDFGKQQLKLMLRERYMHPNGQIPAYEWNFGDVNPPVHAWSTIFTYRLEKAADGRGRQGVAQELLPEAAAELHLVGQPQGPHRAERLRGRLPRARQHRRLRPQRAAADRRLPGAGRRHRLDGAVLPEHARDRRRAGDDRPRLRGHGPQVRRALPVDRLVDGPPGRRHRHVGRGGRLLLRRAPAARRPGRSGSRSGRWSACCPCAPPRCSRGKLLAKYPELGERFAVVPRRPARAVAPRSTTRASPASPAAGSPSILDETKLRRVLAKMLDENEFLSDLRHPLAVALPRRPPLSSSTSGGQEYRVAYLPAESDTGMFGGNSNWRGPIWMPVNALIIRALLQYYTYYGDDFTVECPTGSGRQMNLYQVAEEIAPPAGEHLPARTRTAGGPVYGGTEKFQDDPHWRDLHPVLRVLPRRQRRRPRGQPPDRLDRRHRPTDAPVRDPHARTGDGAREEVVFRGVQSGGSGRIIGRPIAAFPRTRGPGSMATRP